MIQFIPSALLAANEVFEDVIPYQASTPGEPDS